MHMDHSVEVEVGDMAGVEEEAGKMEDGRMEGVHKLGVDCTLCYFLRDSSGDACEKLHDLPCTRVCTTVLHMRMKGRNILNQPQPLQGYRSHTA